MAQAASGSTAIKSINAEHCPNHEWPDHKVVVWPKNQSLFSVTTATDLGNVGMGIQRISMCLIKP